MCLRSAIHSFNYAVLCVCLSVSLSVCVCVCVCVCPELKELVKMHGTHDHEDPLSYDEVLVLKVCTLLLGWGCGEGGVGVNFGMHAKLGTGVDMGWVSPNHTSICVSVHVVIGQVWQLLL